MGLIKMPWEFHPYSPLAIMIYGQPNVGKTFIAMGAEKPFLFDLDHGIVRVSRKDWCPYVDIVEYEQILQVINSDEIDDYKTIIIDTLDKLVACVGHWCVKQNPKNLRPDGVNYSFQGWGAIKSQITELMHTIINKGKNIIFIAHENEEQDGDFKVIRPDAQGSSRKEIIKELDLMGYMQLRNGKRTICFNPTDKFYAKNSVGLTGYIEVPEHTQGDNTFFNDYIIKAVMEQRERDNELCVHYNDLVSKQAESIKHIQTVDDLNVAYAALKEMEVIWDSEFKWKKLLNEKVKALKAVFDKDSGVFNVVSDNAESV